MLDPREMLAVAYKLIASENGTPNDAEKRRAVSTAYYAIFHATLRYAADRFVGVDARHTAAYAIVYRNFSHSRIAEVCKALDRDVIKSPYRSQLNRAAISPDLRAFCGYFVELQDHRHQLDYDPQHEPDLTLAELACATAADALRVIAELDPAEFADVLALMAVSARR